MRHGRPHPQFLGTLSSNVGYPDCKFANRKPINFTIKIWTRRPGVLVQNLAHSLANICSMARAEWVASFTGMEPQNRGLWDRRAVGAKLASIRESERTIRRRGCCKLHRAVCSGRGGCFWDMLLPSVAAKSGSFPFKCLLELPSSQPNPWRALSAEPSRAPLPGGRGAQMCRARPEASTPAMALVA